MVCLPRTGLADCEEGNISGAGVSSLSHTLSTTKSLLRPKAQGKEKSEGERGGREEELPVVETRATENSHRGHSRVDTPVTPELDEED